MNISDYFTELESVSVSAEMHEVFDAFARNRVAPFLAVVDRLAAPVGVIHERDLKEYAYGRFGRELVKRVPLHQFVRPSLILSDTISRDELLAAVASNPNPDGLLVTRDGRYRAVLHTSSIIQLFEANRLETQVRLVQAQKMEAIGTLAGGIAHDLNKLLTPILGYAELLREMVAADEPIDVGMLDDIMVCGIRAKETVGRILSFSRQQKSEQRRVALSEIIREVLRLIGGSLPSTIDTEMCLATTDDVVLANPTELQQVLMNLCTNAYHAMRDKGGHLQVSLSDYSGPLLGWSLFQGKLPNSTVRLTVRDTGTGISPEIVPKIFEPFFTTKKQGEGTGMGLAMVHGVVTRCKGAISVESTEGQGTAFHVYWPRHFEESAKLDARASFETSPFSVVSALSENRRDRVRVLYVDDEFQVTRLAQRYLSRHGLEVETEIDSTKAMTTLQVRMHDFDVLVTDQTMPSISGLELAQYAIRLNPDFPVILCSGYSEIVSPEDARSAGIKAYLSKPSDYTEMAALIRNCAINKVNPLDNATLLPLE